MISTKWVKIWFVLILIIPLVGLFNFKIDSLGFFSSNAYIEKAAQAIVDGKIVVGLKIMMSVYFRRK